MTVYGGFFGGGVNLMVMASLSLMGYKNVQYSNAIKNFLAVMIIASVFVVFLIQGGIAWPQTIVCAFGAITGGFIGGSGRQGVPVAWRRGAGVAGGVGDEALGGGRKDAGGDVVGVAEDEDSNRTTSDGAD